MQIRLASHQGVTFQKCEINWYGPIRLKPPLARQRPPPPPPPPPLLSASRLVPNCFAFACSHSELLIIWCCVAAFGWNSEEPARAAAWRLACAAKTRLKAYPRGGEDGGLRGGSRPTRSRTKMKHPGLRWPEEDEEALSRRTGTITTSELFVSEDRTKHNDRRKKEEEDLHEVSSEEEKCFKTGWSQKTMQQNVWQKKRKTKEEEEEDADTRPAEVFLLLTKSVEQHRADLK